jgi:hypothetical protein
MGQPEWDECLGEMETSESGGRNELGDPRSTIGMGTHRMERLGEDSKT